MLLTWCITVINSYAMHEENRAALKWFSLQKCSFWVRVRGTMKDDLGTKKDSRRSQLHATLYYMRKHTYFLQCCSAGKSGGFLIRARCFTKAIIHNNIALLLWIIALLWGMMGLFLEIIALSLRIEHHYYGLWHYGYELIHYYYGFGQYY